MSGFIPSAGPCPGCGTFISVCTQPPRSTQPGHPFMGRYSEYQPKGGDALRLGSKCRYGLCVYALYTTLPDSARTYSDYSGPRVWVAGETV